MNRQKLLIALLGSCLLVLSQGRPKGAFLGLADRISLGTGFTNLQWETGSLKTGGVAEARAWLDAYLADPANNDPEAEFLRANRPLAGDLISAASGPNTENFINTGLGAPIEVAEDAGQTVVIAGILQYDNVFNTLRVDQKGRVAKVVESDGLQILGALAAAAGADKAPVRVVGVMISYGSRDLSDNNADPAGDTICLTAPVAAARDYHDGQITDVQFMKSVAVFLLANGSTQVQRIAVSISQ